MLSVTELILKDARDDNILVSIERSVKDRRDPERKCIVRLYLRRYMYVRNNEDRILFSMLIFSLELKLIEDKVAV